MTRIPWVVVSVILASGATLPLLIGRPPHELSADHQTDTDEVEIDFRDVPGTPPHFSAEASTPPKFDFLIVDSAASEMQDRR